MAHPADIHKQCHLSTNPSDIANSLPLPETSSKAPLAPPDMILEGRGKPQSSNPARRSILKPPALHVHFTAPPNGDADNKTTPLPQSITEKIPLELIHYCIDSLRDDKATLRSCALVCKSWLARARPLLFSNKLTVTIKNRNGSKVLGLITAPGSGLPQFIHTLSIQTSATFPIHSEHHSTERTLEGQSVSFNHYLLPFIGSTSLRALTLQGITVPPRPWRSTSALPKQLHALSHLTRLEITRCTFSTLNELLSTLCARRTLTDLSLADITITHWRPEVPPPPNLHLPRSLRSLSLCTPGQALIIQWIMSRSVVPHLRALSLGGIRGSEEMHTVNDFLARLGEDLEHFSLSVMRITTGVNLASNTRLRSLTISHYLINKSASENISPKGGLVEMLHRITSPHVEKIKIDFVNAPQDILLMPWAAVSAELDAPKFSGLKTVKMRVLGDKKQWKVWMTDTFSRLCKSHILKIQWDSA